MYAVMHLCRICNFVGVGSIFFLFRHFISFFDLLTFVSDLIFFLSSLVQAASMSRLQFLSVSIILVVCWCWQYADGQG